MRNSRRNYLYLYFISPDRTMSTSQYDSLSDQVKKLGSENLRQRSPNQAGSGSISRLIADRSNFRRKHWLDEKGYRSSIAGGDTSLIPLIKKASSADEGQRILKQETAEPCETPLLIDPETTQETIGGKSNDLQKLATTNKEGTLSIRTGERVRVSEELSVYLSMDDDLPFDKPFARLQAVEFDQYRHPKKSF